MFHAHFATTATKPARPLARVAQKPIPKPPVRPLAYVAQKSASSSSSQNRAETKKRPLALDQKPRAGLDKRAKTKEARIAPLPSFSRGACGRFSGGGGLVGSALESDVVHWERHSGEPSSSTCGRCIYIRNKAELRRDYPWLSPRPGHMKGDWALGCDVCSWRCKCGERENQNGKRVGNKVWVRHLPPSTLCAMGQPTGYVGRTSNRNTCIAPGFESSASVYGH